jgi:hypothetical protein
MNNVKQDGPINYEPTGYNPSFGIYASNYLFTGDWEDELTALQYTKRAEPVSDANIAKFDDDKGIVTNYLYNSFKSADGSSTCHDQIKDFWEEEIPSDYHYTDSYLSSPKLAAICDWFQCEKTRIRIFQQQAGHTMPIHTDFDNQRGTEHGETLRIFVQLNEMPGGAWFHFKTGDSKVSINLRKGQFLIFNPDHTGHGTQNLTNIPRNTFMMVVKRNEWLDNLAKGTDDMTFVNVDELLQQQAA